MREIGVFGSKKVLFLLVIFIIGWDLNLAFGQTTICPWLQIQEAPLVSLNCTDTCTGLNFSLNDIRGTADDPNAYIVESIPYQNHFDFTIPGANPIIFPADDRFSGLLSLPFEFCFFGHNYSNFVVGTNGKISFYSAYANGLDNYLINQPIPNLNYERNTIFALFQDLNPLLTAPNTGVEWAIAGDYPCRKLYHFQLLHRPIH